MITRNFHQQNSTIWTAWNHSTGTQPRHGTQGLSVNSDKLMPIRPFNQADPTNQHYIPAADDPSDPNTWSVPHVFTSGWVAPNTYSTKSNMKGTGGIKKPNVIWGMGGTSLWRRPRRSWRSSPGSQ